jgi:alpha-tubulin suppressor-like RCC1 family protein
MMVAEQRPSSVQTLANVVSVTAGSRHSCAVRADGAAFCWGRNNTNQLGDASIADSALPVQVQGLTMAVRVEADKSSESGSNCAVLADGTARCWGLNNEGQLGNGTVVASGLPVPVLSR